MEEIRWDYGGRSGGNLASATISSMITRVWSARGNARFCLSDSFAVEHGVAGLVFICSRTRGGWLMGLEGRVGGSPTRLFYGPPWVYKSVLGLQCDKAHFVIFL